MTTIISHADGTIVPELVTNYRSSRESNNIIHDVLESGAPYISYRPTGLRTGTIELLFVTHAEALECEALHALPGRFTLTSTERPGINMAFVPSGEIAVSLDDETRDRWLVTVDFHEVLND